jgi:hypothetical protein
MIPWVAALTDEELAEAVSAAREEADADQDAAYEARDKARQSAAKAVHLEGEAAWRAWVAVQEAAGYTVSRDDNGNPIVTKTEAE